MHKGKKKVISSISEVILYPKKKLNILFFLLTAGIFFQNVSVEFNLLDEKRRKSNLLSANLVAREYIYDSKPRSTIPNPVQTKKILDMSCQ